jgi:hypothetical protein
VLRLSDTFAFELPDNGGLAEQAIDPMRTNADSMDVASAGIGVGVSTKLTKAQLKSGQRVFLVE